MNNQIKNFIKLVEYQNEGLPKPVFVILFKYNKKYVFAIKIKGIYSNAIARAKPVTISIMPKIPRFTQNDINNSVRDIYTILEKKYKNLYLLSIDLKYPFNIEIIPDLVYNRKIIEKLNFFDIFWKFRKMIFNHKGTKSTMRQSPNQIWN